MPNHRRRVAGISGVILGCAFLGCGAEEPKPTTGAAVEITPEMEKMKQEMMKNYGMMKTSAKRKAPGAAKGGQ